MANWQIPDNWLRLPDFDDGLVCMIFSLRLAC